MDKYLKRSNNLYKLVNVSLQGFNIFLKTETGPKSFWLRPKESVLIQTNSVTEQIKKMTKKHLLKLERA